MERDFRGVGQRVESNENHIHRLSNDQLTSNQQILDMRRDLGRYANQRPGIANPNNRLPLNLKLPTFSEKWNERPLQFLNALAKYIRAVDFHEDNLHSILDQALLGTCHNWWEFVEYRVNDFNDFRTLFLEKYWNDAAQDRVRRELFEGHYRNDSQIGMADNVMQIYNKPRLLRDAPQDALLVRRLISHFDRDVRRARAVK